MEDSRCCPNSEWFIAHVLLKDDFMETFPIFMFPDQGKALNERDNHTDDKVQSNAINP